MKAVGELQAEAVEQGGLSGFGADHAADAQFTTRLLGQRQDYIGALDAPSSSRMVRGRLPKLARACHCSRVFHKT